MREQEGKCVIGTIRPAGSLTCIGVGSRYTLAPIRASDKLRWTSVVNRVTQSTIVGGASGTALLSNIRTCITPKHNYT